MDITPSPGQHHVDQPTTMKHTQSKADPLPSTDLQIDSELLEIESTLSNIEKFMAKIESQHSTIQTQLRELLESNNHMANEFSDIRSGLTSNFKETMAELEQAPDVAHDLAAVTSATIAAIEDDMSSTKHTIQFK